MKCRVDQFDSTMHFVIDQADERTQLGACRIDLLCVCQLERDQEFLEAYVSTPHLAQAVDVITRLQCNGIRIRGLRWQRWSQKPRHDVRRRVKWSAFLADRRGRQHGRARGLSHEWPPRGAVCINRRTQRQLRAATRTGWRTGHLLREPASLAAPRPSRQKGGTNDKAAESLRRNLRLGSQRCFGTPIPSTPFFDVRKAVYLLAGAGPLIDRLQCTLSIQRRL